MLIQPIKINEINTAEYNPRVSLKPGDSEYEKLKNSIKTFGYVEPLVWNKRTGTLVSGHQRLAVLKEEGFEEVEVSVVDLPLEQEKALNLALNKIRGDWDEEKLASLIEELSKTPEFDMGLTGFDAPEISELLDRCSEPIDIGETSEDPEKIENPITQPGDLIELGKHRILCGDSSKKEDIEKLLNGKKLGLLWTDPPYSVNFGSACLPLKDKSKTSSKWRRIANDNLPQKDYESWLEKDLTNVSDHFQEGAAFYIWNGHRQFSHMEEVLLRLGFKVSCVITWKKERFVLVINNDYNQQTEFCLYGWKEKNGSHRWYGPNNESTFWEITRDPISDNQHPTQKPVELAARAIRNSSKRGDIVLDTFLGSGTTLIAAESLERICYGMELDPRYCDGIVRRYITFVGKDNVSQEIKERYLNHKEVSHV